MGFYDCRCMVTGVSLKATSARLVLLQQIGESWRPIALPILGTYNRLGSIDGISEDANSSLVLRDFLQKMQTGDFVVDQEYLRSHGCFPITDVEKLLACFERNINDYGNAAVLRGRPVVFALICWSVWNALAGGSVGEAEASLWDLPEAQDVYRENQKQVTNLIHELAAVSQFLAKRGIPWKPADDAGQHYDEEFQQYLEEARRNFKDCPELLDAFDLYEEDIEEEDDDEEEDDEE